MQKHTAKEFLRRKDGIYLSQSKSPYKTQNHPYVCSPHLTMSQPKKKYSVAQTCNQLSLFLKEKGCLRINPKSDESARMTFDLLSNMENPDQNNPRTEKLLNSLKPEAVSGRSAAQMTFFYDGQVIVLDDIPADRATDVMLAAGDINPSPAGKTEACPSESNHVRVQANGLDLPIARRASLHKFLAKRKDRAAVRAPYPLPGAGAFKQERNFDLNL
ncbi:hypothetical protein L1987_47806 [Smallanthus sonchifolius]|uniref:Uncharacterized protein n=1 Tax=Smallanthus sonchifolius TaxID=185202 RepID=A0ACB9FR23_9ASTR|nr:hypothetical protein L1987_47806 [Smallanthus sonchifolius]